MKFGICSFPGSNCDYDTLYVLKDLLGQDAKFIDVKNPQLLDFDCIIIPGGFSFGDYLRAGLIAAKTALGQEIYNFAQRGKLVVGICNGFQILTELKLLPGALLKNDPPKFICDAVYLRVENNSSSFTKRYSQKEVIKMPIAHSQGRYFATQETLKEIEDNSLVLLRYCGPEGEISKEFNPNGSLGNIAGIMNKEGNVFGLMPHPERACEDILSFRDGLMIWHSIIS
ncbi:MAG: phosphoribosylformylglycinamidine synthase I [Aquificaceae bacterium]|nr:phosphoribosylformylglycinamidine synthase I [Aquificaceae bacterium]MDW8237577.1 phosphoribosylformylglycinamidine synthase I [Aquificaceae bacterium]